MRNYGYLNNLELKALMHKLDISVKTLAKMCDCPDKRVWEWVNGRAKPSLDVCNRLTEINAKVNRILATALDNYYKAEKGEEIYLIEFEEDDESIGFLSRTFEDLPVSMYNAMIKRLYCDLIDKGHKVHIILFNPESYRDYLRGLKTHDTRERRKEWAKLRYLEIKK